jgi:hypothetical protein
VSQSRQQQVLDFLREEMAQGRPPSVSSVARRFGWRDSAARDTMDRLLLSGRVARVEVRDNRRGVRSVFALNE